MQLALAFAAVLGLAVAKPGDTLWSQSIASGHADFTPVAFPDGVAVTTATSTGVSSFSQATGATLGSFSASSDASTMMFASPVGGLNFFFPGDGTVVGLQGPGLNQVFKTSPVLQFLTFCGADEHVMVIGGRDYATMQFQVLFVDMKTGRNIMVKKTGLDGAQNARCAFLGRSTNVLPMSAALAAQFTKNATAKSTRAALKSAGAVRFHKEQTPQVIEHPSTTKTFSNGMVGATNTSSALFVRFGEDFVIRYDYTVSNAEVSHLRLTWNVSIPSIEVTKFMRITDDLSRVIVGFTTAVATKTGAVRTATNIDVSQATGIMMYHGASALVTINSMDNTVHVYDFEKMSIQRTFSVYKKGTCFGTWETMSLQMLPTVNLIVASTYGGCAMSFDYVTLAPLGVLNEGGSSYNFIFLEAPARLGKHSVLAYSSGVAGGSGSVMLYSATDVWKQRWSFSLMDTTGNGVALAPNGKSIFIDSWFSITAYSL